MNKLVKAEWYFRGGEVAGLFIADEDTWKRIQEWIEKGNEIYFGEILGKHSDIRIVPELDDFKILSEDQYFIEKFRQEVGDSFGTNVPAYMMNRCPDCGDRVDEGEVCVCSEDY